MKTTDLADATARALDLLPPGDLAWTDPRMLRASSLIGESRQTRETTAAVWLAVSPLRVAPPNVLLDVLAEIHPDLSAAPVKSHRYLPWLAASGWAAAIGICIFMWPGSKDEDRFASGTSNVQAARETVGGRESIAPVPVPKTRDIRLRGEIAVLRKRIASFQGTPSNCGPRVVGLTAPGGVRPTPEESRRRVQAILTNALRTALEVANGASSDPADFVIERGWPPGGLPVLEAGEVIRHRNFPEQDWYELGFSRSENGEYYDVSSQTIWTPDPEGRGFIGQKMDDPEEIARFDDEPRTDDELKKNETRPEGFLIENPEEDSTEIFVENVPPLGEGKQLIVRVTDASGKTTDIPLAETVNTVENPLAETAATAENPIPSGFPVTPQIVANSAGANGLANLSSSVPLYRTAGVVPYGSSGNFSTSAVNSISGYLNGGTLVLSFPTTTMLGDFQILSGNILPGGEAPVVLVQSRP